MITPEQFERLFPKAVAWVAQMEAAILDNGQALLPVHEADAKSIGVQDPEKVRIAAMPNMILPTDQELFALAQQTGLISPNTGGMTFGHGILVRADHQPRELIAHELVHVLQYERFGGIEGFLKEYIPEILPPRRYGDGPLEREASETARQVCADEV